MTDMPLPAVIEGDNLDILREIPDNYVDLVYMDPPFFTNKDQKSLDRTRRGSEAIELSFSDVWRSHEEYLVWVRQRLQELRRIMKSSGSIFLHCDWHASHLVRVELDRVFQPNQFRGEIVWYFKRWTNALRSFQRSHQILLFYSKTADYKFNRLYEDYSLTTNIDQIWQRRVRDENGKCVTAADKNGDHVSLGKEKRGVPMRDVWEIPYLNPRSKERTGWPTQKPLELLRRIILSTTDEDDIVLDPVCGSGTTLVAAKALGRKWIGIDAAPEAIAITNGRLASDENPFAKDLHATPFRLSQFLKLSREAKIRHLAALLDMNIVQRSTSVDGFLKRLHDDRYVPVCYVDDDEVEEALRRFTQTAARKQCSVGLAVLPRATKKEKAKLQSQFQGSVRLLVLNYQDVSNGNFRLDAFLGNRKALLALG